MATRTLDAVLDHERQFFGHAWDTTAVESRPWLPLLPGFEAAAEWLGGLEGKRVLEVGCGDGRYSLMLAIYGAEVHATDLSAEGVAATRKRAARWNVTLADTRVADMLDLPYPDGSFDVVFGNAILHHVVHHRFGRQAMDEIRRVLRPGGRAAFLENNGDNRGLMFVKNHLMGRFGSRRHGDDTERPLREVDVTRSCSSWSSVRFAYPEVFGFRAAPMWLPWWPERLRRPCERLDLLLSGPEWLGKLGWVKSVYLER